MTLLLSSVNTFKINEHNITNTTRQKHTICYYKTACGEGETKPTKIRRRRSQKKQLKRERKRQNPAGTALESRDRYLKHSDHNIRGIQLPDELGPLAVPGAHARRQAFIDIELVGGEIGLVRARLRRAALLKQCRVPGTLRGHGHRTAEHQTRGRVALIVRRQIGFGQRRKTGDVRQMQRAIIAGR